MSWWKCTKNSKSYDSFVVGKVYKLDDMADIIISESGFEFGRYGIHIDEGGTINHLRNFGYDFEEVKEMFTMDDIKNGMLVKFRNGMLALTIRDNYFGYNYFITFDNMDSRCILMKRYKFNTLEYMSKNDTSGDFDIVEVICPCMFQNISNLEWEFNPNNSRHIVWKREEPKELTVAQLEEILGYKVKIIADKEAE